MKSNQHRQRKWKEMRNSPWQCIVKNMKVPNPVGKWLRAAVQTFLPGRIADVIAVANLRHLPNCTDTNSTGRAAKAAGTEVIAVAPALKNQSQSEEWFAELRGTTSKVHLSDPGETTLRACHCGRPCRWGPSQGYGLLGEMISVVKHAGRPPSTCRLSTKDTATGRRRGGQGTPTSH